ncbi:MAG TPA: glycosyltransferase family 39 protein [Lacipirellulaceae bacterium]|nr:glycosyltransferase family 39 protein [Lacipirellulaceae bacterium]
MNDAAPTGRRSGGGRLAFVGILLLAAAARLGQLGVQSLSMDEVKDLAIGRGGVAYLQASEDRFPPLYHLLLGAWLAAVPADVTGRGFSAACGVMTVAAVGGLGRELGGRKVGLWAALLTALAPLAIWYSVEARAYGLYLLLASAALWQWMAAMRSSAWRNWAGFAAASIAGAYAHYYFGLLIALAGLGLLAARPPRQQLLRGLTAMAVVAVGTAPSLILLKNDLDQPWGYARTSSFSPAALGYTYFSYLSGYTLGPSLRELHTLGGREAAVAAAPWIALLGAAAGVLLVQALAATERRLKLARAAWFAVFCLAPAAIIGVASDFASFGYNVRHALWACAPLLAMMALGAAEGRPRWLARAAAAVAVGGFLVADASRVWAPRHANEDARAAAHFVAAQSPEAPLFVLAGYMSGPLAAYAPRSTPIVPLPDAGSSGDAAARAVAVVRRHRAAGQPVWLAYTREFHGDPDGVLLAELTQTFQLTVEREFAGIRLYRGTAP